jgi:hypothetical protein
MPEFPDRYLADDEAGAAWKRRPRSFDRNDG